MAIWLERRLIDLSARNQGRQASLLVPGQPIAGVLRRREAQEDRHRRRAGALALRRRRRSRRFLGPDWGDRIRAGLYPSDPQCLRRLRRVNTSYGDAEGSAGGDAPVPRVPPGREPLPVSCAVDSCLTPRIRASFHRTRTCRRLIIWAGFGDGRSACGRTSLGRYRYRWREPERVVLHQVVREQLESFLAPPRSRP